LPTKSAIKLGSVRRKCCYWLFIYLKWIQSLKTGLNDRWYQAIRYQQNCLTELKIMKYISVSIYI